MRGLIVSDFYFKWAQSTPPHSYNIYNAQTVRVNIFEFLVILFYKRALIAALVKKCGKNESDVEDSYQLFHQMHPEGVIKNDDYINSKITKV